MTAFENTCFLQSRVFSNTWSVYHSVIHGLGFFICFMIYSVHVEVMKQKTIKHAFSMFYTLIKHGFLAHHPPSKNRVTGTSVGNLCQLVPNYVVGIVPMEWHGILLFQAIIILCCTVHLLVSFIT